MNYYRRFPGDYLRDTRRLNLLEHGAYTLLLDELYSTEQRIPSTEDAMRICQAMTGEERAAVTKILEKFFKKTGKGFTNNRFEKEMKLRANWRKWQRNHRDTDPDSHADVRSESGPNPFPSPSPSEETSKTFKPPTQAEVCAFMQSRKVPDAERQAELFLAHHENRKWRLSGGRGPVMVSWRKAVVTWQANIPNFSGGQNGARSATSTGASRAEKRVSDSVRQAERVFGSSGRLVGDLRPDLQRRPDRTTGSGLPGNPPRLAIEDSARCLPESAAGIPAIPPDTGKDLRNRGSVAGKGATGKPPEVLGRAADASKRA